MKIRGVHIKETKMILDIVLSIILTFGASGPSGDFNECPAAGDTEPAVAAQTTNSAALQQA